MPAGTPTGCGSSVGGWSRSTRRRARRWWARSTRFAATSNLAAQGVTETFVDLNFDPEIGSPDADAGVSMERAEEILEALAAHA